MTRWLVRQRNILDFALSSLLRRKLKNASLLGVYTLLVFVIGSVMFFTNALKREAALLLAEAPDLVVQRITAGRSDSIPLSYQEKIREIRGVRAVAPRWWGYYYDPEARANYTLMASETPQVAEETFLAGSGICRVRELGKGDLLTFRTWKGESAILEVAGIFPAESELVAADLMLVNGSDFRRIFRVPEETATDFAVVAGNPREIPTIARKITELLPDARPVTREEMLRTYESIFDWRGGIMVVVLASGLLAFVIFAWDKATGLSGEERQEIGILKSIGWETSDVLLLRFWEGIAISLTAFLTGTTLAYLHVFFFSASLFEHALKGWSVLYPQFRLTPFVSPYLVYTLFFLTVLPYTAATIIPAWRGAIADPDAAMRG